MTIWAWMAAALVLSTATVVFLARPLGRGPQPERREQRHELTLLRDRLLAQLNELDVETGDRNLDPEVVQDERRRLEGELAQVLRDLDASRAAAPAAAPATEAGRWRAALIVLALVLPLAAAGLYVLNHKVAPSNLEALFEGTIDVPLDVLKMVKRLEKRLSQQPDDAPGWARLGRSYAVLGRPEDAKAAFARAYGLAPEDRAVVADYAWFLHNQDPSNTEGLVSEIYNRLYRLEPQHPGALWFLGLAAYQKGEAKQAIAYWERLLKILPPESEESATSVRAAIAQARAEARHPPRQ